MQRSALDILEALEKKIDRVDDYVRDGQIKHGGITTRLTAIDAQLRKMEQLAPDVSALSGRVQSLADMVAAMAGDSRADKTDKPAKATTTPSVPSWLKGVVALAAAVGTAIAAAFAGR